MVGTVHIFLLIYYAPFIDCCTVSCLSIQYYIIICIIAFDILPYFVFYSMIFALILGQIPDAVVEKVILLNSASRFSGGSSVTNSMAKMTMEWGHQSMHQLH